MKHFFSTFILLVAIACMMITMSSCSKETEAPSECYSIKVMYIYESGIVHGIITEKPQDAVIGYMPIHFNRSDYPDWNFVEGDIVDIHIIDYSIEEMNHSMDFPSEESFLCVCNKIEPCK